VSFENGLKINYSDLNVNIKNDSYFGAVHARESWQIYHKALNSHISMY